MTRIDTVRLGGRAVDGHGPEVGVQGFGAMGISEFYGDTDEAAARDTLDAALEAGVTLIDTADIYGSGANEEFLAPFLAAHRDEVTLATKFAIERRADDPSYRAVRNDPAYIKRAAEDSLRRLGVETIDLYYMHRRDPEIPFAESVGAMAELVQEGKVRFLGLSEVTGPELREAHAVHPIAALQSEWSLFSRDVERSAVGAAAELGVTFVPYSPLGRGFLTGAFADSRQGAVGRRLPQAPAAVHRRERGAERRPARPGQEDRRRARGHSGADRPGLGAAAVRRARPGGRPDPRHPQALPPGGERGRHPDRPHPGRAGRTGADRGPGGGRPVPRHEPHVPGPRGRG